MAEQLLKLNEVVRLTSLSRSEIYRQMDEDHFPRPVRVGLRLRAVRWLRSEIEEWVRQRPRAVPR